MAQKRLPVLSSRCCAANLAHVFRLYRVIPQDRLRVFCSTSREDLNEQFVQENKGFFTTSVTAAQFLSERGIGSREMMSEVSASRTRTSTGTLVAADANPASNQSSRLPSSPPERSISELESRRLELELGAGGDHDRPYTFALPLALPQTLAWVQLFVKVQQGNITL